MLRDKKFIARPSEKVDVNTFFAAGLSIFTLGCFGGFAYYSRTEKFIYSFRKDPKPMFLALRALGIASIISFGFFGATVSSVMYFSGFKSFQEFANNADKIFLPQETLKKRKELEIENLKIISNMTPQEEYKYWYNEITNAVGYDEQSTSKNSVEKEKE